MRAGFQIDIERAAAGAFTGLFQGKNLGVLPAVVGVCILTGFFPGRIHHYRAYDRIGRGQSDPGAGQVKRAAHVMEFVGQSSLGPRVLFDFSDRCSATAVRWSANRSHGVCVGIFGLRLPPEEPSQSL
jgi:hypothetical protein